MLKVLAIVMLAAHVLVIPADSADSETTQKCLNEVHHIFGELSFSLPMSLPFVTRFCLPIIKRNEQRASITIQL